MERTYKLVETPPGQKGRFINQMMLDGGSDSIGFLHLLDGTPHETAYDVTTALQRAYRTGREDRSGEVLDGAAVARVAAELKRHDRIPASVTTDGGCTCGWTGKLSMHPTHIAQEVLQAAGSSPRLLATRAPGTPRPAADADLIKDHLILRHGFLPDELEGTSYHDLTMIHNDQDHPHVHGEETL